MLEITTYISFASYSVNDWLGFTKHNKTPLLKQNRFEFKIMKMNCSKLISESQNNLMWNYNQQQSNMTL